MAHATFEKGAHPGGSRGVECVVLELTPRWVPLVQLVLVKLGLQRREVPFECDDVIRRAHVSRDRESSRLLHREVPDGLRCPA